VTWTTRSSSVREVLSPGAIQPSAALVVVSCMGFSWVSGWVKVVGQKVWVAKKNRRGCRRYRDQCAFLGLSVDLSCAGGVREPKVVAEEVSGLMRDFHGLQCTTARTACVKGRAFSRQDGGF
jgi:hypothetical protein